MKKIIILSIVASAILSCTNSSENSGDETLVETDVTFSSEINPTKTDWKLSKVYRDTLEFVSCDDSYDYSYAMFKTNGGNSASLICDDLINSKYTHGLFAIEWQIDSLSQAGEGEEMYYDERLLSYKLLEQPVYFGDYLTEFIKAYSKDSSDAMQPFLNEKLGFYSTVKPGLYCMINQMDAPNTTPFIDLDCKVLDEKLVGDPCNGFPNIEDGMYFEEVRYEDIPFYEAPVGEVMTEFNYPLNEDYHGNRIKKVVIIAEESRYVQLYFVNLEGQWYLWAEDFCDCGA